MCAEHAAALPVDVRPRRLATAGVAGFGLLLAATPGGWGLPCPLHAATGLWCPLCGGTRMVRALAQGDVAAAVGFNALALVLAPVAAVVLLAWNFPDRLRLRPPPSWALTVGLAAVAVFTVARNTPWGAALAP
jgi:hypothetical protein